MNIEGSGSLKAGSVKFFPKLVRMNIEGRGSSKVRSVKVFSKK